MAGSTPYEIPRNKYRSISIIFAVLIHLILVACLWLSVSWNIAPPLTVEAEIWDAQYKDAAPSSDTVERDTPHVAPVEDPNPQVSKAVPPPAAEEPEPQPAPAPAPAKAAPAPAPTPAPAPKPAPAAQKEDPEIALAKKRKEEADKKAELAKEQAAAEAQKQAELKKQQDAKIAQQKADAAKKAEADKQAELKKQQEEKLAQQKAAEEQKQAELKKQQDAKAAAQKAADDKKKADAAKKQQEADAKAAQQRRQQELQRMMGQAGGGVTSKTSNGSGEASKSQGPKGQSNYASKIALKIRSNTVFDAPQMAGNPAVEYSVDLFPDGTVRAIHKSKSSGVPGFDEAVADAIKRSEPFPPDTDGKVPDSFHVVHRPKDQ